MEGAGNKEAAVDANKAVKGVSKAAVDGNKAEDAATNLAESVQNNSRAKIGPVSSSTMPQRAS